MIFILGGAGFVGSAFVRQCEQRGWPHRSLTRDSYADHVGSTCDVFVNANGNSRKPLATRAPLQDFDASVRSVRQSLADFRFGVYVYLSSCDVYPDCSAPEVTREDSVLDITRQSPYGFHKYLAESCVRHAAADWLIARLGGFVGPGLWKNAIFDILRGGPLYLDPESELQFMLTDAAAAAILDLACGGYRREVLNVCGKGTVRLAEVAAAARRDVAVAPGSPKVRYDVSVDKLGSLVDVPETRPAVLDFVRAQGVRD